MQSLVLISPVVVGRLLSMTARLSVAIAMVTAQQMSMGCTRKLLALFPITVHISSADAPAPLPLILPPPLLLLPPPLLLLLLTLLPGPMVLLIIEQQKRVATSSRCWQDGRLTPQCTA